eukprot:10910817-Alexandrium_andersonii.AAC.1
MLRPEFAARPASLPGLAPNPCASNLRSACALALCSILVAVRMHPPCTSTPVAVFTNLQPRGVR